MRTLFISLFIVSSIAVTGQAPGYMGKKLTLTYDPAFFISFIDVNGYYKDIPPVGIHIRHDFTATYTISTGVSIGGTFKYLPTKYYDFKQEIETIYDPDDNPISYNGFSGDLRVNTLCYGVILQNFSFRKRGSIAPAGRYRSFELLIARNQYKTIQLKDYSVNDFTQKFIDAINENEYFEEIPFNQLITFEEVNINIETKPTIYFIFGGGSQSVKNDKFLLIFGYEVGLALEPMGIFVTEVFNSKVGVHLDDNDEVDQEFRQRMMAPFFLNFTIGGGYLFGQ